MCSIERLFARMFVRLTCCVSCGIARARSFVCDRGRVVAVAVSRPSWPWRGRRDVAVASLGVAVARRGRGCGVRCLCVAVVWLRHADEC